MSSSTPSSGVPAPVPCDDRHKQLSALLIFLAAANKACKNRSGIEYASRSDKADQTLNDFQRFLCKLALICNNHKGGRTITALVCLKGPLGPNYLFTSNQRKEGEFEATKAFLRELLDYVATNPEGYQPKPLQKQVLWRILEFNFSKLEIYLDTLVETIDHCMQECDSREGGPGKLINSDTEVLRELQSLRDKADFSREMESETTGAKFFKDCEDLFKMVHQIKISSFITAVERRARGGSAQSPYEWCQLRHYIGRLHSYRQASEVIVTMSQTEPGLFKNFTIHYIESARQKRINVPRSSNLSELLLLGFPDSDRSEFQSDIDELQNYGLGVKEAKEDLRSRRMFTMVHTEVNLHHHLHQHGLTRPADFWNSSVFIATSKPPCRPCQYYFGCSGNPFQVQSSHMNVYPRWRLPDVSDHLDGTQDFAEEVMEEMIDQMQNDILRTLKEKQSLYRRNDSRTDSYECPSALRGAFGGGPSRGPSWAEGSSSGNAYPSPISDNGESWVDASAPNYDESDTSGEGAQVIGEAR